MRVRPVDPSSNRSHKPPDQELFNEVVNFLPMCDVGERRVLPADKHTGMQQHGD
jgi:hypothetical protein